jgi:hypothetical protein
MNTQDGPDDRNLRVTTPSLPPQGQAVETNDLIDSLYDDYLETQRQKKMADTPDFDQIARAWINWYCETGRLAGEGVPSLSALLRKTAGRGWMPISEAPKDGTPLLSSRMVRYMPYKPDGRRQMKADGRWQEWNGYGWRYCEDEPTEYMSIPSPPATGEK